MGWIINNAKSTLKGWLVGWLVGVIMRYRFRVILDNRVHE